MAYYTSIRTHWNKYEGEHYFRKTENRLTLCQKKKKKEKKYHTPKVISTSKGFLCSPSRKCKYSSSKRSSEVAIRQPKRVTNKVAIEDRLLMEEFFVRISKNIIQSFYFMCLPMLFHISDQVPTIMIFIFTLLPNKG